MFRTTRKVRGHNRRTAWALPVIIDRGLGKIASKQWQRVDVVRVTAGEEIAGAIDLADTGLKNAPLADRQEGALVQTNSTNSLSAGFLALLL
jgi:hypothetical protein